MPIPYYNGATMTCVYVAKTLR